MKTQTNCEEINIFRELLEDQYNWVEWQQISDAQLSDFLNQDYVKRISTIGRIMDLCYDWVMSQGICDYQE